MNCIERWNHYKKLRWQALYGCMGAGLLGFIPLDIEHVYRHQMGRPLPHLSWVAASFGVLGFALLFYTWIPWGGFLCPKCRRPFFAAGPRIRDRDWLVNPFAGACRNCGLRKWRCDGVSWGKRAANLRQ